MRKSLKNLPAAGGDTPAGNQRRLSRFSNKKNAAPRWSKTGVDWPRVGGRDFVAPPRDLFQSKAFLDRYQPGPKRLAYVATCPGARRLAGQIQMPVAKISTCREGRLTRRLHEQSDDAYGAGYMCQGELVIEPGWDSWDAVLLRPVVGPSPGSPVIVGPRSIQIVLPNVMSETQFDEIWDAETRLAAIDVWAMTECGRSQLKKVGADPARVQRRTVYQIDAEPRISATRELCVYRLTQDTDRLVQIAERIILRVLALI